jgi:peptidyl-prolyl cis-trans isomerase D
MRKHAKYFYVLFFLVIISFIFLYVGPIDQNSNPVLAEIGDEKIYIEEFWRTYDRLRDFYREIYKEKYDSAMEDKLNIKDKALDTLLEERLLVRKAREIGLVVSDRELQDAIMNDPAFMRGGVFRRDVYLRTLQLNRITPANYESQKRRELLLRKMRSLIEESAALTEAEHKSIKGEPQFLDAIRNAVLAEKRDKMVRSYVETLKKEYNVKVHLELL